MSEHPRMQAEVVIVGGGPAGLACALHLARLLGPHNKAHPERAIAPENIYLMEKGREIGSHLMSGAVMDPRGLRELEPEFDPAEFGAVAVHDDALLLVTPGHVARAPITPPPLHNHGNYVVSVNRLGKWLGEKVEAAGVSVFTSVAGAELLFDDGGRVTGVRTDDKGRDREGNPKANFEPGYDVGARLVVLAEGPRGSLTKQLTQRLKLESANPQVYSLGVKEVWELPAGRFPAGRVLHTLGWPYPPDLYGGGWIYGIDGRRISLGLMTALEYTDPATDPHNMFQRFKTHPWVRKLLEGGEMVKYGAKTAPMGGWFAVPPLAGAGWMLAGDSAGLLNSARLKGLHLAIKSGMLAAESAFAALTGADATAAPDLQTRVEGSWVREELWSVRNFHQGFEHGMLGGMINAGLQMASGGRGLRARYPGHAGHTRMVTLEKLHDSAAPPRVQPDGKLTFDKVTDVYYSGTRHEEDQPCHLIVADLNICHDRCTAEYGNPCQYFCPAHVYEMVYDEKGEKRLHLNPSNCVHCKTCDIMDPYEIITWVPPEGGGGPSYEGM